MFRNKKVNLFFATLLCAVFAISCFALPAQADPLSDYEQKQSNIEQEMNALKQEIRNKDKELKDFQSQLKNVDIGIDASEKELVAVKNQLGKAEQQLTVTKKELVKSQDALSVQLEAFETRMRESYMNGEVNIIDVLFDSTSMEDFITRSYYMEKILEYDADMVGKINGRIEDIQVKKEEQQKKATTLAQLKKRQEQSLLALETSRKEKATLVAAAEDDKETSEKAYKEMTRLSNEIAAEIRRIQAANAASGGGGQGTGIYGWPLPSNRKTITSAYGYRTHPVSGQTNKMHTGIDISAPGGTSIYAADSGQVIMAKNNGAYGLCVIIDHGDSIATLYGHMSKILVTSGQTVSRGDTIGKVGSTGWSTGNHLHFEVRKSGNHVSPWNYVSK